MHPVYCCSFPASIFLLLASGFLHLAFCFFNRQFVDFIQQFDKLINMKQTALLIVILFLVSSCSRKSGQQLYQEAQTAEGQKNYPAALQAYQEIIDKSPTSAYAESSLYRIALIYNNDVRDFGKAISAYQQFCSIFPNSPKAPTALFLTGFIYNNELHRLDSAKIMYETFLQKYPSHELATSAKFELETLGKDPTQFLQPQVAEKEVVQPKKSVKAAKK